MSERRIPFVVSGAFALRQHTGICRDTKDLDLFLPLEEVGPVLQELASAGFATEIADPVWLAKAHRGEFYVDLISGMSNGVVTVDRSWIDRGIEIDLLGVRVRVLAAEELFASKLFVTRRERFDGADLCHIIYRKRGQLDWNRVLKLIGQDHWELLLWAFLLFAFVYPAHRDYVPLSLWNDLLSQLHHSLTHPNQNAIFRGSLVDPIMFAIDMGEWNLPDLQEEYRRRRLPKIA